MTYNREMLALHRRMIVERHGIWLARQNNRPQPWTNDPILANLKMTNMFRVLDPGSQFVFELNNGAQSPLDLIARMVFYRITNKPSTWGMLTAQFGRYPYADDFIHKNATLFQILDEYRRNGNRVFSGAYIIIPEPGTANDKIGGALRVVRRFVKEYAEDFLNATTEGARFAVLRSTPGLGPFLSMQILTDWTYLQPEEPDLLFVKAGPGAIRGAALVNPHIKAEDVIYDLADEWADDPHVRVNGRGLTPMDIQNTFCEFGKYVREMTFPRKKSPYKPTHPGVQPKPVFPRWW